MRANISIVMYHFGNYFERFVLFDYFGLKGATHFGANSATHFGVKSASRFGAKGATNFGAKSATF